MDDTKLEQLLGVFDERSWEINREYLIKAARHLKEIGQLPPSDVHRIAEMRRMNTSMREISRTIAEALQIDEADVDAVLAQVAKENDWAARTMLAYEGERVPILENQGLMRMLSAVSATTHGSMRNLSNTTIDHSGYRRSIDKAIHAVTTGVADYNSVIRRCVREMASEGLRVTYPSGVKRRLDTAVRQNVLDGVREVNAESMRILGEGYGADGVEIDAHMLCADDHLPYQGMQYTLDEFQEIQDGLMRPFGQWNCRHNIHYIILGVSPRNYTDRELEEMKQFSTEKIEVDGVKKTRYEWSQTMRRLETKARYQNDETEALKAIGDKQGARISDEKAAQIVDAYNKVCQAVELEPRYDRMYVGRSNVTRQIDDYKALTEYDFDANIHVPTDPKTKEIVDNISDRITQDFPILDRYLYAVGYGDVGEGNPAAANLAITQDGHVGQVIALNKEMWNDLDSLRQFIAKETEQSSHIKSESVDSIISHEYGHVLYNSMLLSRVGFYGTGILTLRQRGNLAAYAQWADEIVNQKFYPYVDQLHSKRANDSTQEFIAEAVSDYYSGQRSELSIKVIEWLKEGFKGRI